MKAEYKNWVPEGMIKGAAAGAASLAFCAASAALTASTRTFKKEKAVFQAAAGLCAAGAAACGALMGWGTWAHDQFSYDGSRMLSRDIVEGVADYVLIPDGGVGLDVGCGSGALTIAAAKRNPNARMVGCDRWGIEYASFSRELCERNARAEGVENVSFLKGDAVELPFEDESFDTVTSNYVYHNISGKNKQELLLETLRVLKKGGTFAIHDIMSPARFGDLGDFLDRLRIMGYEQAVLIPTDNGKFMSKGEARSLFLSGSTLLYGKK